MAVNDQYFQPPLLKDSRLAAGGFSATGFKSGGIVNPVIVDIPAATHLIRFYHDPARAYGEWWATPYELSVIIEYFGRSDLGTGRAQGKGILHASLVVRHDWAQKNPLHLGSFLVARLADPLKAYHGEGDHAPDSAFADVQKAVYVIDHTGRQRKARQIYLPKAWTYQASLPTVDKGMSDLDLINSLSRLNRNRLAFET
jgi:hypothetical protein